MRSRKPQNKHQRGKTKVTGISGLTQELEAPSIRPVGSSSWECEQVALLGMQQPAGIIKPGVKFGLSGTSCRNEMVKRRYSKKRVNS